MVRQEPGVLLTLSTPGARLSGHGFLGNSVASAGIEAFSRILVSERGRKGIRAFAHHAGVTVEDMLAERARTATVLKHLPTLANVGHAPHS